MKVYYLQNENQEIIEDGYAKFHPDCLEMEAERYHIVNGYNGALFFVDYTKTEEYCIKAEKFKAKAKLNDLRHRREVDCFSLVNRGELWYSRLTDEQKAELEVWYQAWLDVTETGVIPDIPVWLK